MNMTLKTILNNYGSSYNSAYKPLFNPSNAILEMRISSLKEQLIKDNKIEEIPCK